MCNNFKDHLSETDKDFLKSIRVQSWPCPECQKLDALKSLRDPRKPNRTNQHGNRSE